MKELVEENIYYIVKDSDGKERCRSRSFEEVFFNSVHNNFKDGEFSLNNKKEWGDIILGKIEKANWSCYNEILKLDDGDLKNE